MEFTNNVLVTIFIIILSGGLWWCLDELKALQKKLIRKDETIAHYKNMYLSGNRKPPKDTPGVRQVYIVYKENQFKGIEFNSMVGFTGQSSAEKHREYLEKRAGQNALQGVFVEPVNVFDYQLEKQGV